MSSPPVPVSVILNLVDVNGVRLAALGDLLLAMDDATARAKAVGGAGLIAALQPFADLRAAIADASSAQLTSRLVVTPQPDAGGSPAGTPE